MKKVDGIFHMPMIYEILLEYNNLGIYRVRDKGENIKINV